MTFTTEDQMNTSDRFGRRRRSRHSLARLALGTFLVGAMYLPFGVSHPSVANAADGSALCTAFDRIRQLDARSYEVVATATDWNDMRAETIRLTVKADRQYAIVASLADGRVRSDIEIQARFADDLRSRLERSASLQEFRRLFRDHEFTEAARSADRLDRYSRRVCGFAVRSPR